MLLHLASPLLIDAAAPLLAQDDRPWAEVLNDTYVTPFQLPSLTREPALA